MPLRHPQIEDFNFCIIIGSMKCGTTSLYEYLSSHPQICRCSVKEPSYFLKKLDCHNSSALNNYTHLWDFRTKNHRYLLESSTDYTKYPQHSNVPKKIFSVLGVKTKLLYIIRDPYQRILSEYFHHLRAGRISIFNKGAKIDKQFIANSKYFMQISQFTDFFPKENILAISLEDLKNDPDSTMKKCYNFLNLASSSQNQFYSHNITRSPQGLYENIRKKLFPKEKSLIFPGFLKPFILHLLKPIEKRINRFTESQSTYVYNELHEDISKFVSTFNINTSSWKFQI